MDDLPDVHFGRIGRKIDWRRKLIFDLLDDDTELPTTPPHVVEMLGFDPLHKDED